ncbi:folylpolyglutamate synthase [Dispira simplex]|nr:folylpolyglutamate synthase [Dispira simplex]
MSTPPAGINLSCTNLHRTLVALGHPEKRLKVIQVAGTNGKGSVCACIASVLRHAGYKVGRFTSPHLVEPRDSIVVNDAVVSNTVWNDLHCRCEEAQRKAEVLLTSFEKLTLRAILWFVQEQVDWAVLEVGVGGTRDATSVCASSTLVSVLTGVALDHVGLIGNTLEEIAEEKCGIFRPGKVVVVGEQRYPEVRDVVKRTVRRVQPAVAYSVLPVTRKTSSTRPLSTYQVVWNHRTSLTQPRDAPEAVPIESSALTFTCPLRGSFQLANLATALHTIHLLRTHYTCLISDGAIQQGMAEVTWPGRLEIHPLPLPTPTPQYLLLDGAHNPDSAQALGEFVDQEWRITGPSGRLHSPVTWVYASTQGKDVVKILGRLLHPNDHLLLVPFTSPEGMPWARSWAPVELARCVQQATINVEAIHTCDSLADAFRIIETSRYHETSPIVVCGSLYLVSDYHRQYLSTTQFLAST